MRDLKFRAWHKHKNWSKNGEPLKPGFEYDFYINSKGGISFPEGGWDIQGLEKKEEYILEQFTGLKDKNGKMIFDGDIVKYHSEETCEIYWEKTGACFYISNNEDNENGFVVHFNKSISDYCEIIGNIHENPNLLK